MKKLDLHLYGVQEMTQQEMVETEGGSLTAFLVIAAASLLLSSCVEININSNNGCSDSSTNNQGNGNGNANGNGNGNGK